MFGKCPATVVGCLLAGARPTTHQRQQAGGGMRLFPKLLPLLLEVGRTVPGEPSRCTRAKNMRCSHTPSATVQRGHTPSSKSKGRPGRNEPPCSRCPRPPLLKRRPRFADQAKPARPRIAPIASENERRLAFLRLISLHFVVGIEPRLSRERIRDIRVIRGQKKSPFSPSTACVRIGPILYNKKPAAHATGSTR